MREVWRDLEIQSTLVFVIWLVGILKNEWKRQDQEDEYGE